MYNNNNWKIADTHYTILLRYLIYIYKFLRVIFKILYINILVPAYNHIYLPLKIFDPDIPESVLSYKTCWKVSRINSCYFPSSQKTIHICIYYQIKHSKYSKSLGPFLLQAALSWILNMKSETCLALDPLRWDRPFSTLPSI